MAKRKLIKEEEKPWYKEKWSKFIVVGGFVIGAINFYPNLKQFYQDIIQPHIKTSSNEGENTTLPFPKKFQKDSLYVLVTRFEDYISKKETECFGHSLIRRIDVIKIEKNLPVSFKYEPKLAPKTKDEASKIQKQYNADLVFWGSIKNIEKDCGAGDLCFRSQPSDTLIHLAGGDTSPQKMDVKYEIGISPSDVEQGAFHVNEKRFDSWLLAIYNVKIGRYNPDLYVIDESLNIFEKVKANLEKSQLFYTLNKYQKALKYADVACDLLPISQAYSCRGRIKYQLNDFKGSILDFTKAIELDPQNPSHYLNRSTANYRMNKFNDCIDDLTQLIALDSSFSNLNLEIFSESDIYNLLGIAKMNIKDFKGAISSFSKAISSDSTESMPYSFRGKINLHLKNYENANKDFSKAILLEPTFAGHYYWRGKLENELKQHEVSVNYLSSAIKIDPIYKEPYFLRGKIYMLEKKYRDAEKDFSKIIELDSINFPDAFLQRGVAQVELNNYENAVIDFTKYIQINPKSTVAYIFRGVIKMRFQENESAVYDITKAIKLSPQNEMTDFLYHSRGVLKYRLIDYKSSIIDFNEAIRINPKYAEAYFNRGEAKEKLGLKEEAKKDFLKAKQLGYVEKKSLQWYYPLMSFLLLTLYLYIFKNKMIARFKAVNK